MPRRSGTVPDEPDDALLAKLQRVVDGTIPQHWPADYASQKKAFNLVCLMGGYVLLIAFYVPVYFWQGAVYAAWAAFMLLAIQCTLMRAMRSKASFNLARYVTLGNVFLTSTSILWLQGAGPDNPQGVWIAFAPFAAAFVAGVRQALVMLLLCLAFLFAAIWLRVSGVHFFYMPAVRDPVVMNTIHILLILLGFTLLGLSFLVSQTLNEHAMNQARQKADKLSQAKSEFLSNLSHEIHTPMNAIVGMSHLVLQTDLSARQRKHITHIHRSVQSLLGIISGILDFSKIEAGKLVMEHTDFSLDDVLNTLSELLGPTAADKGLELLYAIAPDVPTQLVGDPLRLEQILLNLGTNAVKFTDAGQIVLSVDVMQTQPGRVQLQFRLQDTGVGIAADQLDNLFQSFQQGDSSTTRKYGGTGMGLAISKALVEQMHGRIHVESTVGLGSTFGFDAHFELQAAASSPPLQQRDALNGKRVLVVDDNTTSRTLLANTLQSLGMQVSLAAQGDMALEMLMQAQRSGQGIEVALVDWQMPGMDGMQCTQKIQDLGLLHPPAVLMLTAHGDELALGRSHGRSHLIKEVIIKPAIASTLSAKVLAALHNTQAEPPFRAEQQTEPDQQTRAMAQLRGARILLAEDNEVNRELAVELFEYAGLTVVVADHGQEALDILKMDQAFDGILMDCQMPVMDGYTATRHLRQRAELSAIPVIAMTANTSRSDRDAALDAGMCDHISKPLDLETMFVTMAQWIRPHAVAAYQNDAAGGAGAPKPHVAAVSLPRIDGVNQDFGISVCGGNKVLYRRLLVKFAQSNANFGPRFLAALQDPDGSAATRCAHSLKGSAANLGIQRVQALAWDLEMASKDRANGASTHIQLERVLGALQPVIQAIERMQADDTHTLETAQPENHKIRALWLQLSAQLSDDDAEALTTAHQLKTMLAAHSPPDFGRLVTLVENFEFSAALAQLNSAPYLAIQQGS